MNVGNRIKELREQSGLTTNGLATKAGIAQSYLRDVELGKKNPTIEMVGLICDAMNISVYSFFNSSEFKDTSDDEIIPYIYKLTSTQKKQLLEFLKTIVS